MTVDTTPLVSIVTPSFNQARFLEETLRSVLNQDYPRIEYLVVDGGSTDGSVDIVRRYEARLAYWVSEPDRGQSHAINKGWRRAKGQIVAYLNSDDTYLPGAVRAAVEFLESHPDVGIVYGDCLAIDETGETIEKYEGWDFDLVRVLERCQTPIPQPSAFIRASLLDRVGLLDESLHVAMDFDFWLRSALQARLVHIPVTLATYRLHRESKSVSQGAKTGPDVVRIYARLFERPDFPKHLARRRRFMSSAFVRAAEEYYAAAQLKPARDMWLRAWTLYPPALGTLDYARWLNTWLYPLRRHKALNGATRR